MDEEFDTKECQYPPLREYLAGSKWTCSDCGTVYYRRPRVRRLPWRRWGAPEGYWGLLPAWPRGYRRSETVANVTVILGVLVAIGYAASLGNWSLTYLPAGAKMYPSLVAAIAAFAAGLYGVISSRHYVNRRLTCDRKPSDLRAPHDLHQSPGLCPGLLFYAV